MRFNPNTGEFESVNTSGNNNRHSSSNESGVGLWGVLFFLIPFAGWIMYFTWRNSKPKKAKQANICAIFGLIFNIFIRLME